MEALKRFVDFLDQVIKYLVMVAFGVMSILIVLQVFFRYVLGASLSFSEELARFLFIWSTMLGAAMCFKRRSHIGFNLLIEYLPRGVKKYAGLVTSLLSMVFFVTIIIYGFKVVGITMGQTSPAMGVPMGYIYLSIPVAGVIMVFNGLYILIEDFRKYSTHNISGTNPGKGVAKP